ncbi:MAG: hypothetical protein FJW96_09995 [Actinobacteria bacterium]|nr:hypothetical protein [Actinomycetota bacterium]
MSTQSSLTTPSVQQLRERCAAEGVHPSDDELAGVVAFLDTILPVLAEIEGRLEQGDAVAGLFLPEPGTR